MLPLAPVTVAAAPKLSVQSAGLSLRARLSRPSPSQIWRPSSEAYHLSFGCGGKSGKGVSSSLTRAHFEHPPHACPRTGSSARPVPQGNAPNKPAPALPYKRPEPIRARHQTPRHRPSQPLPQSDGSPEAYHLSFPRRSSTSAGRPLPAGGFRLLTLRAIFVEAFDFGCRASVRRLGPAASASGHPGLDPVLSSTRLHCRPRAAARGWELPVLPGSYPAGPLHRTGSGGSPVFSLFFEREGDLRPRPAAAPGTPPFPPRGWGPVGVSRGAAARPSAQRHPERGPILRSVRPEANPAPRGRGDGSSRSISGRAPSLEQFWGPRGRRTTSAAFPADAKPRAKCRTRGRRHK